MKQITILSMVFFIISCNHKMYVPVISNIPETEEGSIYLQTSGFGKSRQAAFDKSVYNAFNMLLFQGIPGTVQPAPMIEPADAGKARTKVEKCMTNNACYKGFILQEMYDKPTKISGGIQVNAKVKINLRALRTYLEQNKLVSRPFTL